MELQEEQIADVANIKAVYLVAEDLKIAASILYLAYYDDPLFVDIFHVRDQSQALQRKLSSFLFWLSSPSC